MDTTTVILRMRDVAIALGVAGSHGQSLNRIRLQKFVYLMDAVAVIFKVLPLTDGYYTFKHGPFDPAVQNAVDSLAFRGLVSITSLHAAEEGTVSAVYTLSVGGQNWFQKLGDDQAMADRIKIGNAVAERVDRLGWWRLRELVYAEPTFLKARTAGYGRHLAPHKGRDVSTARLLQVIMRALRLGNIEPTRDSVLDAYFDYLDRYAKQRHHAVPAEDQ